MILIGYRLNEESTVLLFVSGRREAKLDPLVKFRVWLVDGDKVGGYFYAFLRKHDSSFFFVTRKRQKGLYENVTFSFNVHVHTYSPIV